MEQQNHHAEEEIQVYRSNFLSGLLMLAKKLFMF
ncbi:hypothetical protein CLV82_0552 [Zeaxanthinibacter enoshimensis]|uniref:Uncharacterized protein n=1 Tax=Zeaxanthinibacter enoshimensis TaxID=392009 RepID=A0A4R6TS63_9FLAO|nr:hypothetical protein CLV82_0552 [Zeaxanthinibacter enoshimensis]